MPTDQAGAGERPSRTSPVVSRHEFLNQLLCHTLTLSILVADVLDAQGIVDDLLRAKTTYLKRRAK